MPTHGRKRKKTEERSGSSPFTKDVIRLIRAIPEGRVATYGQIAALAGKPGAARGVVWILNSSSKKYGLPWQRVVAAKGRIAFPARSDQAWRQTRALEAEGVAVESGKIDLEVFGWKKRPAGRRKR